MAKSSSAPDPLRGLKDKEKFLTDKLKRFESGEIKGQDDAHTEEAKLRAEAQLREVKKALSEAQPKAAVSDK